MTAPFSLDFTVKGLRHVRREPPTPSDELQRESSHWFDLPPIGRVLFDVFADRRPGRQRIVARLYSWELNEIAWYDVTEATS